MNYINYIQYMDYITLIYPMGYITHVRAKSPVICKYFC